MVWLSSARLLQFLIREAASAQQAKSQYQKVFEVLIKVLLAGVVMQTRATYTQMVSRSQYANSKDLVPFRLFLE